MVMPTAAPAARPMRATAMLSPARRLELGYQRSDELSRRVIEGDLRIDELEQEVQMGAVRMLALRQPMACDLREALAAIEADSAGFERCLGELERLAGSFRLTNQSFVDFFGHVPDLHMGHACIIHACGRRGKRGADQQIPIGNEHPEE